MNNLKRILAIDYGSKRIGIAISDPLKIIANGLEVLQNSPQALLKIKNIIDKYELEAIIVGYPLNLKGKIGYAAKSVEDFIHSLKSYVNIPVIMWDERFSSVRAHQTLREMNVKRKIRQKKSTIDKMAAAFILQNYLDSVKKK